MLLALLTCVAVLSADLTDAQKAQLTRHFGFGAMQIYKFDDGIGELVLADLNHDGRTDVACWNARRSRIEILYQPSANASLVNGAAPASSEPNELPDRGNLVKDNVPVTYRVTSMEVADLTGDGRNDIVFFGEPKELVILPGRDSGGFGTPIPIRASEGGASAGKLCVGDFNQDQRTDVALLGPELLLVFHQNAEGGLDKAIRIVHNIRAPLLMLSGDLDGDGRDDLIIGADDEEYGAYVILQQPDGGLGALRRVRSPKLRSITLGSSPGGDDVYSVIYATGRLRHSRWQTPPELAARGDWPQLLHAYPVRGKAKRNVVALGDVTGDGLVDVITADPDASQLVLFEQAEGRLRAGRPFPGLSKTVDLQVIDMDQDGRGELVSVSAKEKTIGVSRYENGRLTFPSPMTVEGEPLVVAHGSLRVGQAPDRLAYVTRIDRSAELILLAGGAVVQKVALESLSDEPAGLRFADVNGDGLNDLLLFVRFAGVRTFLQKSDGVFEAFAGPATRDALLSETSLEGFAQADLDGDGKLEAIFAGGNVARAMAIRDGQWVVVDQYNPDSPGADLTGLAVIPGGMNSKSPLLAMYDKNSRELLVLRRGEDAAYRVALTMPVGAFEVTAMSAFLLGTARGESARWALALADAQTLAIFLPGEPAPTLVEQHSYQTEIKDAWLADAIVGDLNHDGVRDLAVIDMRKANIEILTSLKNSELVKAFSFQVFQGKRFSDAPDAGGEPREGLIGDVTGDGIDDLVLLVHDRVIIYPGQ